MRAQAVSAIELALRARARRDVQRRWMVGLAVAATVAALVFAAGLALRARGSGTAAIERLRVLSRLDRSRAADAARRYLHSYPHGSAREEAQRIAGMHE